MTSRLLSLAVWALVAATAAFWGLKLWVRGAALDAKVQMPVASAIGGDLSKLLGESAQPVAEEAPDPAAGSDRFRLIGVVSPSGAAASTQGVALISVADQPAKAWKTGAVIEGEVVLLSVGRRSAQIGPRGGPPTAEISLPPLATPAVGSLPPARMGVPVAGAAPSPVFNRVPGTVQAAPPAGVLVPPAPPKAEDDDD